MSVEYPNAMMFKEYFTNIPVIYLENRKDPHWQKGVEMSDWWLRLQGEQSVQQSDIDAFLERHGAEVSRRSMWMALGLEFRRWARERGFYAS